MSNITPSADDMRVFACVARLASFTKAAAQLQVPRATVSTAVLRLESRLGARLLQRTTRRVHLTSDGEQFLERCERVLADLEDLATLFQHGGEQVSGRLRVDMPLGMSTDRVMARLPEFLSRHPALQVDVYSTDRRIDVVADGFDCVIRVGAVVDESLACRPLGSLPLINVVSAAYLQMHGEPRALEDLPSHWMVNYQSNPGDVPAAFDYLDPESKMTLRVPMRHLVTVNNSAAYAAACRAGLGLVQIPKWGVIAGNANSGLLPSWPLFHQPLKQRSLVQTRPLSRQVLR
ncbi:MAG: LysR family transcriptional regulator [Pseudomonadota bacterium]|nr:LysR family transcriptional regulator [Pseudomonadota bacterium]